MTNTQKTLMEKLLEDQILWRG